MRVLEGSGEVRLGLELGLGLVVEGYGGWRGKGEGLGSG